MSKIITTKDGKSISFAFDENPQTKEVEKLITSAYKNHKIKEDLNDDKSTEVNSILIQAKTAYGKVLEEKGDDAAANWLNDLQDSLEKQRDLTKERANVFKKGEAALAAKAKGPNPSLEYMESKRDLKKVGDIDLRESSLDKIYKGPELRKQLRSDKDNLLIQNRIIDHSLLSEIEATKLDVAKEIDNNDGRLEYLLNGNILDDKARKYFEEKEEQFNKATGPSFAKIANNTADWLLNGGDPKNFRGIWNKIQKKSENRVISDPTLHPDLSNPFLQKKENDQRLGSVGKTEERLLNNASDFEDERHAAQRKALNKEIQERNEQFYKDQAALNKENHHMIPGKLLRILLMANPFLGGVLTGLAILQPFFAVIDGVKSFNNLVLSPIKLIFGDNVADAIKGAFSAAAKVPVLREVVGVLNVPNELISIVTDNSISKAITSSTGGLFKNGEIMQVGIAAAAACWDFHSRTMFGKKVGEHEEKHEKSYEATFKKFKEGGLVGEEKDGKKESFKGQRARREEAINKFAKENAVNLHEAKKMKLEEEVPNLLSGLDNVQKAQLNQIVREKLNSGEKDLQKLLEANTDNPVVKNMLVLVKDGKLDDLKKALVSTEEFDKLLNVKKDDIGNFIKKACYVGTSDNEIAQEKIEIISNYKTQLLGHLNNAVKIKPAKYDEVNDQVKVEEDKTKSSDSNSVTPKEGADTLKQSAEISVTQRPSTPEGSDNKVELENKREPLKELQPNRNEMPSLPQNVIDKLKEAQSSLENHVGQPENEKMKSATSLKNSKNEKDKGMSL